MAAALASTSQFSTKFVKEVSASEKGNIVYSPLSCQVALTMAYAGAKDETAECLSEGLCMPGNVKTACQGLGKLINNLIKSKEVELYIANTILVMEGFPIMPDFTNTLEQTFGATVQNMDFTNRPVAARLINDWVAKETKNTIKTIVDPGTFNEDTRMLLINAIFFKGQWVHEFKEQCTSMRDFFTDATKKVKVLFMTQTQNHGHAKLADFGAQLIELEYKGGKFSIVIILPNEKTGLPLLEKKLLTTPLTELLQRAETKLIELYLPKFTIETTLNLEKPLKKIGLEQCFSDAADFTGISSGFDALQIDKVVQKVFIKVDEKGTTAAAVTRVGMRRVTGKRPTPLKVDCNRPFVFFLVYKHKLALFGGRLTQP